MRRIRKHLSYANVMVTILAFIVLTGGTAVALNGSNTVQSDDLGPGAQVKAPDVADNAVNGADVVNGSIRNADLAPAARGARAYGRVDSNATVTRKKNVVSVTRAGTGIYCIKLGGGINPASAVLVVAPDFAGDATNPSSTISHVEWDSLGSNVSNGCPVGTLTVRTFVFRGDSNDNDHGGGDTQGDTLFADDESFAFVVP
jgi:hypothetical protein